MRWLIKLFLELISSGAHNYVVFFCLIYEYLDMISVTNPVLRNTVLI